nr:metal-dependent transcriptional regulator [Gammaproteobacteria bacterium]
MGYSKASVSIALKKLKADELVVVEDNGNLKLTDEGFNIGSKTYDKHKTIAKLLVDMGVSEETALKDACRIEHIISDETYEAIKKCSKENG